jgi:hypothetical protein
VTEPATLEVALGGAGGPGARAVTVWLPQGMIVDLLDLRADAPVIAAEPSHAPVWIHHGSSISHCVETPSPTGVWPVIAARTSDLSLINLGFGGQCMLDPFVADTIAATPADVITLKVGINIVGRGRSISARSRPRCTASSTACAPGIPTPRSCCRRSSGPEARTHRGRRTWSSSTTVTSAATPPETPPTSPAVR